MIFQQKLLEKAYRFIKMTGPAMVRPAGSDFWKAPYVFGGEGGGQKSDSYITV